MPERLTAAAGYPPEQVARVKATCLYLATKLGDLMPESGDGRNKTNLNEFWGLDENGAELRTANRFIREGQSQRMPQDNPFGLGERSMLGRFLAGELGLDSAGYAAFLDDFLALLVGQGLLRRLDPLDDDQFFQLDAACLLWRLADGSAPPLDPLYARRTTQRALPPSRAHHL